MTTVDLEGMAWIGNIYQKFEAMCLEVEEVMYQDTVKYVENQVQTVGASVKKFYSEVVHDLLPPSSIDPVKVAAADLSLNPYADFGIYKKPKASIKRDTVKIDKQVTEDLAGGNNTDYISSFSGLHTVDHLQPPSVGLVKGAGLELCLEQNKDRSSREHSNVTIKRKSRRNNCLPSEMSRSITPLSEDLSRVLSCREMRENHEVARDQVPMLSCPEAVDVTGCDSSGVKLCNIAGATMSIADASIDTPTSNMILLVESGVKKEAKLRPTSSNGDVLSAELNGTSTKSGVVSLIGSYINGDPQYTESASDYCLSLTGREGDCNLEVIENDDVIIEPGMVTIEQFDNSKLEETCVLVDGEKFCLVAHREDKPKSYKKKIQKAFSSKRSARKQEYEKLALQHGNLDAGSNQESAERLMPTFTMDADTTKSPPHGVCESEWELL